MTDDDRGIAERSLRQAVCGLAAAGKADQAGAMMRYLDGRDAPPAPSPVDRWLEQIDEPAEDGDPFFHPHHGWICRRCFWFARRVSGESPCPCVEDDSSCPATETPTTP
jgi:hypothetical protein